MSVGLYSYFMRLERIEPLAFVGAYKIKGMGYR